MEVKRGLLLALLPGLFVGCTRAWTDVDDPAVGFRASFPASPVPTSDGTMTTLTATDLGWVYTVRYASVPDGLAVDRDYLESLRDLVVSEERPVMGISDTSLLDPPNGVGMAFAARGEASLVLVGHIVRVDRRVFVATVKGRQRVAVAPDTKRFFDAFTIDPRPEPVKASPRELASLDEGAARAAAKSYVALIGSGRIDEAWRYLPASTRERVPAKAHAAWWKQNMPTGGIEDARVTTVVVHGTSADISVIGGSQTVKLVAVGQGRSASVFPAGLVPERAVRTTLPPKPRS